MPPQVDLEGSGRIELLIVIQLIDYWKQEVVMKWQISALLILCANIYLLVVLQIPGTGWGSVWEAGEDSSCP